MAANYSPLRASELRFLSADELEPLGKIWRRGSGLADPCPIALDGRPALFGDVFGEQGHPVRAMIPDLGPLLLSRILNLNETQSGVLALVFKIGDDNGLLLLDIKDLHAMLQYGGDNAQNFTTNYGNVSAASGRRPRRTRAPHRAEDGWTQSKECSADSLPVAAAGTALSSRWPRAQRAPSGARSFAACSAR